MRVRYLVLIVSLFLAGMFAGQLSFAHPPDLHDDRAQIQIAKAQAAQAEQAAQEQPPQQDETINHEHGDNTAAHHHNDTSAAPADQGGKPMADHHAGAPEGAGQGHEGGGHDDGNSEASGHSHWGISPDSTPYSKAMAAIGKFHPLIVHFPIALFLVAAFAQILNIRAKNGVYDKTVSLLVWLGAFGTLGAGLLGWAHSGPVQTGENVVMSSHRWIGTGLLVGGLVTAYLMTKAKKTNGLRGNKAFNVFLFAMAIGVAVNGFLGGSFAHGGIKHLMPGMM